MPPRIMQVQDVLVRPDGPHIPVSRTWVCFRWSTPKLDSHHARWTGLLLMAELSVGHTRYGEPRWERLPGWRYAADPQAGGPPRWVLTWPCRHCSAEVTSPTQHTADHRAADRMLGSLRLARLQSYGPLSDA